MTRQSNLLAAVVLTLSCVADDAEPVSEESHLHTFDVEVSREPMRAVVERADALAPNFERRPSDDAIVAAVGDDQLLEGEVRLASLIYRIYSEVSPTEARERALADRVHEHALYALAVREGLEVSTEEARSHRDEQRQRCERDPLCPRLVALYGPLLAERDYWSLGTYARALTIARFVGARVPVPALDERDPEPYLAALADLRAEAVHSVEVTWHDREDREAFEAGAGLTPMTLGVFVPEES